MKKLDLVLAWALVVIGIVHCGSVFAHFHQLTPGTIWFFTGGIAIFEGGVLNVLRNTGGRSMSLSGCIAANVLLFVASIALLFTALVGGHILQRTMLLVSLVVIGGKTLFSINS